jgi:hypothetical protein
MLKEHLVQIKAIMKSTNMFSLASTFYSWYFFCLGILSRPSDHPPMRMQPPRPWWKAFRNGVLGRKVVENTVLISTSPLSFNDIRYMYCMRKKGPIILYVCIYIYVIYNYIYIFIYFSSMLVPLRKTCRPVNGYDSWPIWGHHWHRQIHWAIPTASTQMRAPKGTRCSSARHHTEKASNVCVVPMTDPWCWYIYANMTGVYW